VSQRVVRLVSAGVPISDAFQAAVEEIIDNGSADFDGLAKRIEEVMRFKETRLIREAAWRTWADFAADIVNQLLEVGTVIFINDKYYAPEFVRGVEYSAIPNANPKVVYTVWDEVTRLKRDADARKLMAVRRVKSEVAGLLDLFDWEDDECMQLKRSVGSFTNMEKRLNGPPSAVADYRESPRQGTSRKGITIRRHGVTESVEGYAREFPEFWFGKEEVVKYWNQRHPDEPPLDPRKDTGAIRREFSRLTGNVLLRRGAARDYQYRLDKLQGFQPRLPCGGRGFPVY
jgi:hypothetical protein